MATAKERGIPSLGSALIRPTTQPDDTTADPIDDQADDQGEGRVGEATEGKPRRRTRARKTTDQGATKGRKLGLPEGVFERLQLRAIQQRKTISAVATEILDRNLPKLTITHED